MARKLTGAREGKALLVVLSAVFVALAIVVAWVWSRRPAEPDFEAGRQAADTFLEQIRGGHASEAWHATTAEFKSAEGRESFLRYVKRHPELAKPASFVSVQTVKIQDSPRPEYLYHTDKAGATVRVLAGYDRGAWRVDRLTMEQ